MMNDSSKDSAILKFPRVKPRLTVDYQHITLFPEPPCHHIFILTLQKCLRLVADMNKFTRSRALLVPHTVFKIEEIEYDYVICNC